MTLIYVHNRKKKKKKKSKRYLNQALVNYGGEFSLIDEDNSLK